MKRIYLVRHCKASGQEPNAYLTEEGIKQSHVLSDFFRDIKIGFISSSPFERAISTIRPLSDRIKLDIHTDVRLSERVLSSENLPDWMDKLEESFVDLDMKLPGGESSCEAMERAIHVMNELWERTEDNIIVVTHGNLLSLILKFYDNRVGFENWGALTNPDIFELVKPDQTDKITIKRVTL